MAALLQLPSSSSLGDVAQDREVRVRLTVFDVPEIVTASSRFTCNFFLEASWLDPTLTASGSVELSEWDQQFPYRKNAGGPSQRWSPKLNFDNVLELRDKEDWFYIYTKSRDGLQRLREAVVCYRLRATGVFRERFELHTFPFDAQDLQIHIVSMHAHDDLQLTRSPSEASSSLSTKVVLTINQTVEYSCVTPGDDKRRFTLYDEYIMHSEIRELQEHTLAKHSSTRKTYPLLILSMKVTRRPRFYLWHVYLPMFMLVFLTFPILLIPLSELSDRLGNIFALLLAAVAYKNWIGDNLPRCSYLTELDMYVMVAIVIIFAVALESAFVYWVQKYLLSENGHSFKRVDVCEDVLLVIAAVAWIVFHVRVYTRCRECENCSVRTEIERLRTHVSHTSTNACSLDSSRGNSTNGVRLRSSWLSSPSSRD